MVSVGIIFFEVLFEAGDDVGVHFVARDELAVVEAVHVLQQQLYVGRQDRR